MTAIIVTTSSAKAEFRVEYGTRPDIVEKRVFVTHPKGMPAAEIVDLLNEEADTEFAARLTARYGVEVVFIGEVFDEDFGE